jgi:hypothetical protein
MINEGVLQTGKQKRNILHTMKEGRPYHLHSAESHENLKALAFRIPKGLLRPVEGKVYLFL